jgi:hypothetical protein
MQPKAGRHFTKVTPNRSAPQFADDRLEIVAAYPEADTIHRVMDNLSSHRRKALVDRRRNWLTMLGLLALFVSIGAVGCGGGGGSGGSGGGGGGGNAGTTPGTYTVTVTGTSGSLAVTLGTLTLTVQ